MKSFQQIFKTVFARNVATLLTGTTIAQAIAFVITPLITRMYSSSDIGMLAVFMSIIGILGIISCFSYELTIVLPEKDADACNLLMLSVIISLVISMLSAVIVFFFRQTIAHCFGLPQLAPWLWLVPPCVLGMGTYQAFNYWSTRNKSFKPLAITRILQAIVTNGSKVSWPLISTSPLPGLIGGQTLGQTIAAAVLGVQIWRKDRRIFKNNVKWNQIREMFFKYKDFPLYSSPVGFINTISLQIPTLLLAFYFTPMIVGFYDLTFRTLIIPMNLIGTSFAQVFFPQAAEEQRKGQLGEITGKIFSKLFSAGFIPMLLFIGAAPDLFGFIFGSSWRPSGFYAQVLCPWFFFQFLSSPLISTLYVLEKQRTLFIWNISFLLSRLVVLITAGLFKSPAAAIVMLAISGVIMYGLLIIIIFRLTGADCRIFKSLKKQAIWVPYVAIYIFIVLSIKNPIITLILFCFSIIIFLLFLLYLKDFSYESN